VLSMSIGAVRPTRASFLSLPHLPLGTVFNAKIQVADGGVHDGVVSVQVATKAIELTDQPGERWRLYFTDSTIFFLVNINFTGVNIWCFQSVICCWWCDSFEVPMQ